MSESETSSFQKQVQQACRNLHFRRLLSGSPLLDLPYFRGSQAARDAGLDSLGADPAEVLAAILESLVAQRLEELRGTPVARPSSLQRNEDARQLLREDIASESRERRSISILFHYLARWQNNEVESWGGVGNSTRHRLFWEAIAVVAQELKRRNARVLKHLAAPTTSVGEQPTRYELSDPASSIDDLASYRQARSEYWRTRPQLDRRFVKLTLLLDAYPLESEPGESRIRQAWVADRVAYDELKAVLVARQESVFVLLGAPGSGKSTLLRDLEMKLAADDLGTEGAGIPFYVQLNRYRSPANESAPPEPWQWLSATWRAQYPMLPDLETVLGSGMLVLLLDGLNEIPHSGERSYSQILMRWKSFVRELLQRYPSSRVVFSCRSLDYSAPLSSAEIPVPQIQIAPLSDDQVEAMLSAYCGSLGSSVWEQLSDTASVDLYRTPFMLMRLAEAVQPGGGIPANQPGLLTRILRVALLRELEREHPLLVPGNLISARDSRRITQRGPWKSPYDLPSGGPLITRLGTLAYSMQDSCNDVGSHQVGLPYEEALAIVSEKNESDVVDVGAALGVLEEADGDILQFVHQLVQEYFAARMLATSPEPERGRSKWRVDQIEPPLETLIRDLAPPDPLPALPATGWEETIVMAAAMADRPDNFIDSIAAENVTLAARCIAQNRLELPEKSVVRIQQDLIDRSRDLNVDLRARIAAGEALGQLGDPRFTRREGPHGEYLLPPMIEIQAGDYPIGSDDHIRPEVDGPWPGVRPTHKVSLDGFHIGQFPVTNAEWALFIQSGGYASPEWWSDTDGMQAWHDGKETAAGRKWALRYFRQLYRSEPEQLERHRRAGRTGMTLEFEEMLRWIQLSDKEFERDVLSSIYYGKLTQPEFWGDSDYDNPAQPVVGISWYEARAYCAWLSAQTGWTVMLPSEVEWEAAARGRSARKYPHGDVWLDFAGNTSVAHVRRPSPVGVFPEGDSPEGMSDLVGNASEWTRSLWGYQTDLVDYFNYPYEASDGREDAAADSDVLRIIKGSNWMAGVPVHSEGVYRGVSHPASRDFATGMRLMIRLTQDSESKLV